VSFNSAENNARWPVALERQASSQRETRRSIWVDSVLGPNEQGRRVLIEYTTTKTPYYVLTVLRVDTNRNVRRFCFDRSDLRMGGGCCPMTEGPLLSDVRYATGNPFPGKRRGISDEHSQRRPTTKSAGPDDHQDAFDESWMRTDSNGSAGGGEVVAWRKFRGERPGGARLSSAILFQSAPPAH